MKSSVIMVPGVGTASPETWFEGKGYSWHQTLDAVSSPVIYQFDHRLSLDTHSKLWSDILDQGLTFLEALLNLVDTRTDVHKASVSLWSYTDPD